MSNRDNLILFSPQPVCSRLFVYKYIAYGIYLYTNDPLYLLLLEKFHPKKAVEVLEPSWSILAPSSGLLVHTVESLFNVPSHLSFFQYNCRTPFNPDNLFILKSYNYAIFDTQIMKKKIKILKHISYSHNDVKL